MDAVAIPSVVDRLEARLVQVGATVRPRGEPHPVVPHVNMFTPGMYIREIYMPAGAIVTSETHRHEHPYVVSQGRCFVFLENEHRWEVIQAPHTGITKAGTRRFLIIVHDTIWTTFHVTDKTDMEEVEAEIFMPRDNPLLKEIAA